MNEDPQERIVVNEVKLKPLISDSQMARWVVGAISTVLTLVLGWAVTELSEIGKHTTQILEDVELAQIRQAELGNRVDRISQRVDTLFERELSREQRESSKP